MRFNSEQTPRRFNILSQKRTTKSLNSDTSKQGQDKMKALQMSSPWWPFNKSELELRSHQEVKTIIPPHWISALMAPSWLAKQPRHRQFSRKTGKLSAVPGRCLENIRQIKQIKSMSDICNHMFLPERKVWMQRNMPQWISMKPTDKHQHLQGKGND